MTQFHGNLRGIDGRQLSGRGRAAGASDDRRSEGARRDFVRDADGVGNRQIGHSCVDHRHRHAGKRSCQRGAPAALMHEAMSTTCVVVLLRIATVVCVAGFVVVVMDICRHSRCVLGGVQFTELDQDRLDQHAKYQQRQNADA